jgi:hypothetical protein
MRAFRIGAGVAGAALLVLFSASPALADEVQLTGSGSGAEEAPDPGENGATIDADITVDTDSGKITYTVKVSGNSKAPAGEAGDVVVELDAAAVNGGTEGTATVDPAVAAQLAASPQDYYVNAHSPSFQGGFARAQLEAASPSSVPTGDGSSASTVPTAVGVGLVIAGAGAVAVALARRRREGGSA